jgi:hypothetical protein
MLIKLLRYELKAVGRIMLPLYGFLLLTGLLTGLMFNWNSSDLLTGLMTLASVLLLLGTGIVSLVLIIQRFWTNLLKDEGYLMFTLPVGAYTLVGAKTISALIWMLLGNLVAFAALTALALLSGSTETLQVLSGVFRMLADQVIGDSFHISLLVVWLPLVILTSLIQWALQLYASMSVGQIFNRRRALAAAGTYFLVFFVQQTLIGRIVGLIPRFAGTSAANNLTNPAVIASLYVYLICQILFAALYFWLSGWLLQHKLNLE